MRIVFFGATELGYKCCEYMIDNKIGTVVGIFTSPCEFNISYSKTPVRNVLYSNFKIIADKFKIPLVEVKDKMHLYYEQLRSLNPEFIVVAGWYYMIPKKLRCLASNGCAGLHASLLPKYRGGAPLVWAMINGETKSGVSLFLFGDGVDSGDILAQKSFIIDDNDTIKEVIGKATEASLEILKKYVPKIADGTVVRTAQNQKDATYVPQRTPGDGLINWSWEAKDIRNFIRAQTKPYPGAFTIRNGNKLIIWEADVYSYNSSSNNGEVINVANNGPQSGIFVSTKNGVLLLKRVQEADDKELEAKIYAVRSGVVIGEKLG
jgi:methionyl-tRNA formyltransferase